MNIEIARQNMIKQQIRSDKVVDEHILEIFKTTAREFFVPEHYQACAFADMNIPIAHGEVMMTPNEEAHLLQSLNINKNSYVLEIGTGTGYTTALIAKCAKHVESMEIYSEFSSAAAEKLTALKISNVNLMTKDAMQEWPKNKKYDAIAITGAMLELPQHMLESLNVDGRLFAILGQGYTMHATVFTRTADNDWVKQTLFETKLPMLKNAKTASTFKF